MVIFNRDGIIVRQRTRSLNTIKLSNGVTEIAVTPMGKVGDIAQFLNQQILTK